MDNNADPWLPCTKISFKDTVDDKSRLVRFSESPIMSTYLVAIVVGEFEASETKTKDNITVRCLTPMGKVEQGRFALEASKRALEYYTEFFNVPYPLPKVILKYSIRITDIHGHSDTLGKREKCPL